MTNKSINKLSGKTVLVTASLKRLGRDITLALAGEGAYIAGHYRTGSEDELVNLKEEVASLGGKITFFKAELDKENNCIALMDSVYKELGRVDFLVNNASIFPKGSVNSMKYGDIEENIKINTWAPFILSRLFYEKSEGGAVVNILDSRIKDYGLNHAPYYLSKRMLADITHLTALEFSPAIRVNGVAPGLILPPEGEGDAYLKELKSSIPLKKYGDKSQVSESVLFLLKNDFITGQIIYVDGGAHIKGGF